MDYYNLIGITGAAFILYGLYRTTQGKWRKHPVWTDLNHAIGSALLIIYLLNVRAYIGIVINVAYFIASLVGLNSFADRRLARKARKRSKKK